MTREQLAILRAAVHASIQVALFKAVDPEDEGYDRWISISTQKWEELEASLPEQGEQPS